METLDVNVNLKAHNKGRDRLIAIAKAHAEQLREGKQPPEGEADKIRKKKKKPKKPSAEEPTDPPDGDEEMTDTAAAQKAKGKTLAKVKVEPSDDNDKKPGKGFAFEPTNLGQSLGQMQLSGEMGSVRLSVKNLDNRITHAEQSLHTISTDMKVMKESIHEVRCDNAENKTVLHMLLEGQGWSQAEIDKRMAGAQERAKRLLTEPDAGKELESENISGSTPRSETSVTSKRSLQDMELTEVQMSQALERWSKDDLTQAAVRHGLTIDVFASVTKAMIIAALSHKIPDGLWAVMPDIGVNQGKFCAVAVRVCEFTKGGVLRWGANMPARPEPWFEKGDKIDVEVPQDLCLSNIFIAREDALDKAKVPAARRGRKTTTPITSPPPCIPTLAGLPTVVGVSSTSHGAGATPPGDEIHSAAATPAMAEPTYDGGASIADQNPADEATSPMMAGSQNGCGQEPDHPNSHTMSVDDDADII